VAGRRTVVGMPVKGTASTQSRNLSNDSTCDC
jgi:hypothetical protein